MIENFNSDVNVNQRNILIIKKYTIKLWNLIIYKIKKKNMVNIKRRELVVIFIFSLIEQKIKMEIWFTNLKKVNLTLIIMSI